MKTHMGWLVSGVVGLLVALTVTTVPALAHPAADPPGPAVAQQTPGPNGMGRMNGPGGMGRMPGAANSLIAVAARTLNMTPADLLTAVQGGQSVASVAVTHNVTVATIVEAFVAPRTTWLDQQVAAGRLTAAERDSRLATMRTEVTERLTQPWTAGSGMGPGNGDGDGDCDMTGTAMRGGGYGRGGR